LRCHGAFHDPHYWGESKHSNVARGNGQHVGRFRHRQQRPWIQAQICACCFRIAHSDPYSHRDTGRPLRADDSSPMTDGMRVGERYRERRRSTRGRPWDVPCVAMSLCSSLIILFHFPSEGSITASPGARDYFLPTGCFREESAVIPPSWTHVPDSTIFVGATDRPPQQLANDVASGAGVREGVRGTFPALQCHCGSLTTLFPHRNRK
jgi:hypothetical protein